MLDRSIFSARLKELREKSGLSYSALAEKVGVTGASLGYYERGERVPDIETTQKLCKVFGVTSDYLLGLSDTPSPDIEDQAICKKLGCSGDMLIALKEVFEFDTFDFPKKEKNDPFSIVTAVELQFMVASCVSDKFDVDFFFKLRDYIVAKVGYDKLKNRKNELKAKRIEIMFSNGWNELAEAYRDNLTIAEIQDKGYDISVVKQEIEYQNKYSDLDNEMHTVFENRIKAKDELDLSTWRLEQGLYIMLDAMMDMWYEKYGGTEWQA